MGRDRKEILRMLKKWWKERKDYDKQIRETINNLAKEKKKTKEDYYEDIFYNAIYGNEDTIEAKQILDGNGDGWNKADEERRKKWYGWVPSEYTKEEVVAAEAENK